MKTPFLNTPLLVAFAIAFVVTSLTWDKKQVRSFDTNYSILSITDTSRTLQSDSVLVAMYNAANSDTLNKTDKDGLRQGHWVIYGYMKPEKGYGDSCKIEEGPYKDNRKNGTWVKYHLQGCNQVRLVGVYKNNRPDGDYSKYHEDGSIFEYGNYQPKKIKGHYKVYSENGLITNQAIGGLPNSTFGNSVGGSGNAAGNAVPSHYLNTGTATRYYPNGDSKMIASYGVTSGKKSRRGRGKRSASYAYTNSTSNGNANISNGGPSGTKGKTKDGKSFNRDGYNKLYNSGDEVWMDGEFKNSQLWDGKLYKYDQDGILLKVEIWKNGKYHSDGSIGNEAQSNEVTEEDGLAGDAKSLDRIPEWALMYERYNPYNENEWVKSTDESKSTFSIDVDNASYTNFRRFVEQGYLPPKDAIRMEEWLNFFNYDLNAPTENDEHPLKIESEIAACPWAPEDDLVMIKMQGKLPPKERDDLPPSNLVFLVDASGSMGSPNKLPLVQSSMKQLVESLRPQDNLSIVTYAGTSEIVLKPTSGDQKNKIIKAIDGITSGGGTYGSKGLTTAYELAEENLDPQGNNRIIIASDGDWNIGVTKDDKLKKLIEEKRESGIYLSVLGFGMRNLNDKMMEMLADNGNGNYAYIDKEQEAERIFKLEFAGTMHTIAKDVKLQVLFDSTVVDEYRLIGYENRVLENWQFEADSIDAGDLGMGQNVIAFYQVKRKEGATGPIGNLDFRYKPIDSDVSTLLSHAFGARTEEVSSDFNFASCVIEFALCLRESEYRGDAQMERAIARGRANLGDKSNKLSYEKRVEFVGLGDDTEELWEEYVVEEAPELEIEEKPELKLFPNPTSDFTTVEVPEDLKEAWSVQIFAMNGALKIVEHFRDVTQGKIDVNDLERGTYIIKVYRDGFNFGYLRLVKS